MKNAKLSRFSRISYAGHPVISPFAATGVSQMVIPALRYCRMTHSTIASIGWTDRSRAPTWQTKAPSGPPWKTSLGCTSRNSTTCVQDSDLGSTSRSTTPARELGFSTLERCHPDMPPLSLLRVFGTCKPTRRFHFSCRFCGVCGWCLHGILTGVPRRCPERHAFLGL